MKKLTLFCLLCLAPFVGCSKYPGDPHNSSYPASNWPQPVSVKGGIITLEGFVQVDRNRLFDVRAKEFNGNYFIGSEQSGGKIVPIHADYYDRLSRLVGQKVRITGRVRPMKSGDEIQIETLERLKNTQHPPAN